MKTRLVIIVSCCLLALGLISALNFYVNPYGFYGDAQVANNVGSVRSCKLIQFKDLQLRPEAVVLGSSNSLRMMPSTITQFTDLDAYNFGVYWATVEDYFCITNYLLDQDDQQLKLAIICLDVFALKDQPKRFDEVFRGAENRLAYQPELSRFLPDFNSPTLQWYRFKTSLSLTQTMVSLKFLRKFGFNRRPASDFCNMIFDDGTRKKYDLMTGELVDSYEDFNGYDVGKEIHFKHQEIRKQRNGYKGYVSVPGMYNFSQLSERRLDLLKKIVALLGENDVKVVLNIMPIQADFRALMVETNTNQQEKEEALVAFCEDLQQEFPNVLLVKDNSRVDNFNGDDLQFFDGYHPTVINSDSMLYSIFHELDKSQGLAF